METGYYKGRFSLTQNDLKIIAVIAMLIDHIGWVFVKTDTPEGQFMHFIGRFTMPIMCYFIAEGYERTRNRWKYFTRLAVFALISHFPFQYFMWGYIPLFNPGPKYLPLAYTTTGVIYTLALGLLALIIAKSGKLPVLLKVPLLILIMYISQNGDYGYIGVLWVLFFGLFHHDRYLMTLSFISVTLAIALPAFGDRYSFFRFGTFFPIILILLYNGKRERVKHKEVKAIPQSDTDNSKFLSEKKTRLYYVFLKWFFYIFYPLHLIVLGYFKSLKMK